MEKKKGMEKPKVRSTDIKELLEWSDRWASLTKVQKGAVKELLGGSKVCSFSELCRRLGIKPNNGNHNLRQVVQLERWGVVEISSMEGFRKKRRWALSEGWRDNLMKADMDGKDKSKSYYENWEREEK